MSRGDVRPAAWAAQVAIGAGLLAGSWRVLDQPAAQRIDVRVGDVLRRLSVPRVDRLVTGTTDLGSLYGALGVAGALGLAGRRDTATDVLGVGSLAWVLAQTNKRLVRRQRPYEAHEVRRLIRPPTGSSFPSGHAAVAGAVMSLLAERARGPRSRRMLRGLGWYVAASRVYVGVHYPTDVIGGAGLGMVLGACWRGPLAALPRRLVLLGSGPGSAARTLPPSPGAGAPESLLAAAAAA